MTTLTAAAARVNSPTAPVTAVQAVHAALARAGFAPIHRGGLAWGLVIDGRKARLEITGLAFVADEDRCLEDDTLTPDAEDALYASWADGILHDAVESVLQRDRIADTFVGAECTCHADRPAVVDEFPVAKYATEGLNPRKAGYIADERIAS